MRTAALVVLGLVGCVSAPARPPAARAPECAEPVAATATPEPVSPPPAEAAPAQLHEPDPTWALSSADIVLQLEVAPTFVAVSVGAPDQSFGRVPAFTMYRDGTVIYTDVADRAAGVFTYRAGEYAVKRHLAHVFGLGFTKIRSSEDGCRRTPEGKTCVADASVMVLRARPPGGRLREIQNYAGWTSQHQAQLDAIYDRIELLRAPRSAAARKRMYLPPAATLFMRALDEPGPDDAERVARAKPWPLATEWIDLTHAQKRATFALDVPQIQAIIAATGTNNPTNAWFDLDGRLVIVTMVPWLPGVDHRAAIARAGEQTDE